MDVKVIIYGNNYYSYSMYDSALEFFENSDYLSNEIIYGNNPPENTASVFHFLESEGMVKLDRFGIAITEKGKNRISSGGYVRMLLIERIKIISVFAGIFGFLATLIALLKR